MKYGSTDACDHALDKRLRNSDLGGSLKDDNFFRLGCFGRSQVRLLPGVEDKGHITTEHCLKPIVFIGLFVLLSFCSLTIVLHHLCLLHQARE